MSFCTAEETVNKLGRQSTQGKTVFANYIPARDMKSKIDQQELVELNENE